MRAEALHHLVLRRVRRAEPRRQQRRTPGGCRRGWSIATCSLIDRCIDRCRNGFSRPPSAGVARRPRRIGVGEVGAVLGMRVDPVGGDRLERRQRQPLARRLPARLDEEVANVVGARARTWRRLSRPAFSAARTAPTNPLPRARAGRRRRIERSPPTAPSSGDPHERHHRTALRPRPHAERLHRASRCPTSSCARSTT